MIKLIARRVIKADCIEAFQTLAQELAAKSRAEEGCVFYTLNQSETDPRLHCFIEAWRDQDAIDRHNASEHFTRIVPQFNALTDERLPLERYIEVNHD